MPLQIKVTSATRRREYWQISQAVVGKKRSTGRLQSRLTTYDIPTKTLSFHS